MVIEWLRNLFTGDKQVELKSSPVDESLAGLNLKEALDAHNAWKHKLESAILSGSTVDLDANKISQDNLCTLGEWLHGPGKQLYSHLAGYKAALKAHAKFHTCAAEVLIQREAGNKYKAHKILNSKFLSASNKNRLELVRLFSAVKG